MAMYIVGRAAAGPWTATATPEIIPRDVLADVGIGTITPETDLDQFFSGGLIPSGLAVKNEETGGTAMLLLEQEDSTGSTVIALKNKVNAVTDAGWLFMCPNETGSAAGRLTLYNLETSTKAVTFVGALQSGAYDGQQGPVIFGGVTGTVTPYDGTDTMAAVEVYGQAASIMAPTSEANPLVLNMFEGNCQYIELTADMLLNSPISALPGGCYNIICKQTSGGGHAITFNSDFLFVGGSAPTLVDTVDTFTVISLVAIEVGGGVFKFLTSIVSGLE